MKISVTVKPNSKKTGIEKESDTKWIIKISQPPLEGKANAAVEAAVAKELGVSKSKVRIVSGLRSRNKILEILDN